ncbi:tetratricopeptide repeat protein [Acidiphilium acidophilum]|uniref:tetratricopeptide repeat protein n=1 Tax=Acidiphilium acidophilum TaxID=76588 RepID=UPI002E8E6F77|nr:tetratricopeptide repeat protein [Acidiphilium acidophilum]
MIQNRIAVLAFLAIFLGVSVGNAVAALPGERTSDASGASSMSHPEIVHPTVAGGDTDETSNVVLVRHELSAYRAAALLGNPVAMFYLGEAYYDGIGVSQDQPRGIRYLRTAANHGNPLAATFLGAVEYLHATDNGERSRAVSWLHRGAHGGDRYAQRELGIIALDDSGSPSNTAAIHWLHLAALQGDDLSQRLIGELDTTTTKNLPVFKRGEFWLEEAAKQGDDVALSDLIGLWSQEGRLPADLGPPATVSSASALTPSPEAKTTLANFYFGRSSASATIAVGLYREAAKSGYGPASFGLADAYFYGRGIAADQDRARQGFKDAAAQGDVRALVNLGTMYYFGMGGSKSLPRAAGQYRLAADRGSAEGAYYLAKMIQAGQGVKANPREARHWYSVAAARGLPVAQRTLASMPFSQSRKRSPAQQRVYWLRRAALSGDPVAARELAQLYRRGDGVTANRAQALYWLQRAVKGGDHSALVDRALLEATQPATPAQARTGRGALKRMAVAGAPDAAFDLGAIYARGVGVTRDDRRAVFWWRIGVRQKDPDAILALAIAYLSGTGVQESRSNATHLLLAARALNLDPARQHLVDHEIFALHSGRNDS